MKRLEFHISYICNHNCIFCSEYDRMNSFKRFPLTIFQIKTILLDRRKKGFNHVNFTGGEPTIFPDFLNLLKFAKKIGYKIYVGTNGIGFSNELFAEEALKYIDELSLSIHWFDNNTCVKQTGNKDHFHIFNNKIIPNIKKYKADNIMFFSNVVINKYNFLDIINIVLFIISNYSFVNQILISNIAPEGLANHNYKDLVFDLKYLSKYITNIITICNNKGINIRFFGIPNCFLGEKNVFYSNDRHWEERNTIERFVNNKGKVSLIDIYSPDNSRKRSFQEKCMTCKWRNKPCTGVFSDYVNFFPL